MTNSERIRKNVNQMSIGTSFGVPQSQTRTVAVKQRPMDNEHGRPQMTPTHTNGDAQQRPKTVDDVVDMVLSDGKHHVFGKTTCGYCQMQKASLNGQVLYRDDVGEIKGRPPKDEKEMDKVVDPEIASQFVMHYVDDPNPTKRQIAEIVAQKLHINAYPSFVLSPDKCDWRNKPEKCRESGLKGREALTEFHKKNS